MPVLSIRFSDLHQLRITEIKYPFPLEYGIIDKY